MSPAERRMLAALKRGRTRAQLQALFALIRREDDATLLEQPAKAAPARRADDPLLAELRALFAPVLARSAEKGDLLAEELAALHPGAAPVEANGFAATVRKLRRRHSDAQIRAAAKGLMARLAREYGTRERVT